MYLFFLFILTLLGWSVNLKNHSPVPDPTPEAITIRIYNPQSDLDPDPKHWLAERIKWIFIQTAIHLFPLSAQYGCRSGFILFVINFTFITSENIRAINRQNKIFSVVIPFKTGKPGISLLFPTFGSPNFFLYKILVYTLSQ